jgi:EAL domain-containing protein (putative c-di-GMP-specific phosphodiesterase class I)
MSTAQSKHFNLHWQRFDHYWIAVFAASGTFPPPVKTALESLGMREAAPGAMAIKVPRQWKLAWDTVYATLQKSNLLDGIEAAVMPSEKDEKLELIAMDRRPVAAIKAIADSLWLGDALIADQLMCYLQPVFSGRDKIFGYESFARAKAADGSIIGGDKIIAASRVLNIEYMIDRHLHVEAIKTFVSSEFNGFLFINFFPDFIMRPAVYLEGLGETAKSLGMVAKNLVLDFTKSEMQRDLSHLKSVCEYGRSRGYSLALDDIESFESARKLLPEIRPDFVKIDMQLVHKMADADVRATIRQIVELAHTTGASVIGEGIEDDEMFQQLKTLGVDLFQGYYFSPPLPVEKIFQKASVAG